MSAVSSRGSDGSMQSARFPFTNLSLYLNEMPRDKLSWELMLYKKTELNINSENDGKTR